MTWGIIYSIISTISSHFIKKKIYHQTILFLFIYFLNFCWAEVKCLVFMRGFRCFLGQCPHTFWDSVLVLFGTVYSHFLGQCPRTFWDSVLVLLGQCTRTFWDSVLILFGTVYSYFLGQCTRTFWDSVLWSILSSSVDKHMVGRRYTF